MSYVHPKVSYECNWTINLAFLVCFVTDMWVVHYARGLTSYWNSLLTLSIFSSFKAIKWFNKFSKYWIFIT